MNKVKQLTLDTILSGKDVPARLAASVKHSVECSIFFAHLLTQNPSIIASLDIDAIYSAEDMMAFLVLQPIEDEASLKRALRQLRQTVMARLIIRDLNQMADLNEVMLTTSLLAEIAVQTAVDYISRWLSLEYGSPSASIANPNEAQSLMVVGMGKLGGYELNVSSDIDLIFAYEAAGETVGEQSISNQEFFTKVSKQLINVIDDVTEDGFVFRVDMRLRPYGSEGSLVCSLDALENYYQANGREWERYAWIKGRVIVGDGALIYRLLKPFVFRKYLDYGAFSSMRDLKKQIQQDVNRRDLHENIKLGRGGIREIEFIAQVFQLMRGGQEPSLQVRPTLNALINLTKMGLLSADVTQQLSDAYTFLRNLEHRLQYYEDAQTHELPKNDVHRAVIAKAMRFAKWDDLLQVLNQYRSFVSQQFDEVFAYEQTPIDQNQQACEVWSGAVDIEQSKACLGSLGFQSPADTDKIISVFKVSRRVKRLPEISRQRLNAVMPMVITLSGRQPNAADTLLRMIALIETICQRASYLAFFVEYPQILSRLVALVSASPWIASYLSQHPVLLDSLIESESEDDAPVDNVVLEAQLMEKMQWLDGDTEQQMNVLREFQQMQLFALASKDVMQHIPLQTLSDLLSDLADIILRVVIKTVWPTIKGRHCDAPKFSIIAYGKHGGLELGYSSDLDMVFLYEDDHDDAREVYSRFGMRIIAWLNTMTSSGILYETDMQLRPNGNSGLLVISLEGFKRYQFEKAWVWEHQAITRARFAVGDAKLGKKFEALRKAVLVMPRDEVALKEQVLDMRNKMKDAYRYVNGRFDLKKSLGGMIDIEFIVQYLVLAHAKHYPALIENCGNIKLLERCAQYGLIPVELSQKTADAYVELRRQQHALRLQGQAEAAVPESSVEGIVNTVRALWRTVFYSDK